MSFKSTNPATGLTVQEFPAWGQREIDGALEQVARATPEWASTAIAERCNLLRKASEVLKNNRDEYARLITLEMGKRISEARAEIEKCALACDFYADKGPTFLADEIIESDAGRSFVAYQPLGTVLAVMPWNFPFWQVLRFAVPALIAGNTAVLKHAANVPQCALAIESMFTDAGFPAGVFRTLMITSTQVADVIADPRIHAVTLTGSDPAGRQVAAQAGAHLKKTVLELGGSDPFVVLEDADLELAVQTAVTARFLNAGQSCIAAKRFILVEPIADEFLARFKTAVEALQPGDPLDETSTLGPMARGDLRDDLHEQVQASIRAGAEAVTGCEPLDGEGFYYKPSILDQVTPGMPAYEEEFFGPVAIVLRAKDEAEAMRIANDTSFGLGGSIWTQDNARGESLARQLECGCAFVNGMVKSDPRLPFGGIKTSGYGCELSYHGMREFTNAKTIWIK